MPMNVPPMARPGENEDVPTMPPMGRLDSEPTDPSQRSGGPGTGEAKASGRESVTRESAESRASGSGASAGKGEPAAANLVRTAQQFQDALRRLGEAGGTIRVAADADIEMGPTEIRGTGRYVIQADSGQGRPRLSFNAATASASRPAARPVLLRVQSGTLELEGFDVVFDQDRVGTSSRNAVFGIWAGAELHLSKCTVTLAGENPRSAIVAVMTGEGEGEAVGGQSDRSAASVRVSDCLLRSGGDFIDVAAGRRLELDMTDSVVSTAGSLAHGHGLAHGHTADPLKLVLRQISARVAGGLVQLESAPGEPELPLAEVVARDSIFATTDEGAPLFRIDGQDNLDDLRDRLRWEGHTVAYHLIGTYRRDQTAQIGTLPVRYDRPSWEMAVGAREQSAIHGDLRFAEAWEPSRSAWTATPADFRLRTDSPALTKGADLLRIPNPPRSRAQ
jgi:serine/threonine-protein kinase